MIPLVIAAAVIVCETGSTCIVQERLNPTEKARQDFLLQQERIRPKETELEKAQKRFKEDQERLRYPNHPRPVLNPADQCLHISDVFSHAERLIRENPETYIFRHICVGALMTRL